VAKGIVMMIHYGKGIRQKLIMYSFILFLFFISILSGWQQVKKFFEIQHSNAVEVGIEADKILPKNAKVIAPYNFDPTLLYQTKRYGWTIGGEYIPRFLSEGATHIVATSLNEDEAYWIKRCKILSEKKNTWIIVDMTKCNFSMEQKFGLKQERLYWKKFDKEASESKCKEINKSFILKLFYKDLCKQYKS